VKPASVPWSRGFTLSLIVGLLLSCTIREDEFACEDAISHLEQCCEGFAPTKVNCSYVEGGDGCSPVSPTLGPRESACIRTQSCDALRANGGCGRAAQLESAESPDAAPEFCPGGGLVGRTLDDGATDDASDTGLPMGVFECASAADCLPGLVCCAVLPPGSQCATACALGPQLCAGSSECPAGEVCSLVVTPLSLCQVADAATSDASQDSQGASNDVTASEAAAGDASKPVDANTETGSEP
jgi:hypothetical protein